MLFRNKQTVKQTGVKTAPAVDCGCNQKGGPSGQSVGTLMTAVYAKLISPTSNNWFSPGILLSKVSNLIFNDLMCALNIIPV